MLTTRGEFIYFHKAKIDIVGIIRMIQGALVFEWSYSLTTDHNTATTVRYYLPMFFSSNKAEGSSWSWSHVSCIYNNLCNQCLSPVVGSNPAYGGIYSIQYYVIKLSAPCCMSVVFSDTPISSTNKTDHHDIIEILLLKVALNTISQKTNKQKNNKRTGNQTRNKQR